ncbi:MAG TPA: hypothetical protein VN616_12845 [Puia sp.]|nr:hypothetical protein [Puia sp.]
MALKVAPPVVQTSFSQLARSVVSWLIAWVMAVVCGFWPTSVIRPSASYKV